ncbi:Aste57867_8535 [Aphanomyces stellatus]|uniref:Aste57867_8535 protein n=1 Tax=Aphanomyces stellatus TaxID=120398 RepID=A0A485KKK9_9STRA|nr:hypothetical protein As57867_008503 [Aphanomyces stellatus]VFT85421.1 Aste57867_8535 [Aphanomyces stellatus]
MDASTPPIEGKNSKDAPQEMLSSPVCQSPVGESPATPRRSAVRDRLKSMLRGSVAGPTEQMVLTQKMHYYSTMRIHMKRVQYALEEEKRNSFYKELLVYLVFLAILMMTVCILPVQIPYEHNSALDDIYLDQEFNNVSFKKNFYEVNAIEEMWQWFDDVLLDVYYNSPELNSRRVTSIQVRTSRMQGMSCAAFDAQSDALALFPDDTCYPAFHTALEDTAPYGDDGFGAPYTYEKDMTLLLRSMLFTPSIWNARMDYGTGGHTVYLPRDNATAAAAIVDALKDHLVLPSTRYVATTWNLYNPSSSVFTHLVVMFEYSQTDHIELTQRLMSFRVVNYTSFADFFTTENVLMLFLAVVTLWFTHREISNALEIGFVKYTESIWNLFDILQVGCLYVLVYKWTKYLVDCRALIPTLRRVVRDTTCTTPQSGKDCFVDMGDVGLLVQDINNISAVVALVSVAIVFKYLRLNTRLNMLWKTLRLAAKDLIAFLFIFFFIFLGYGVMGFLLFGSHVREYRSISGSLASCFQMLLGAFDFEKLSQANPVMSGLFFFSFMVIVFLIVVNMFIAILSEYYSMAQEEKRAEDENKKNLLTDGGSTKYDRIEYDVIKQMAEYWKELRWRVKLPRPDPIPLQGGACVLLVDYSYLMAERARLRAKFRASVRVIRICIAFIKPLRKFFSDFDASHVTSSLFGRPKMVLRTKSSHHVDYRKFPVTYVPLHSKAAKPLTMINQLHAGDLLELDDGSLTFDRICLQVMGPQELYLRDGVADPSTLRDTFGLSHVHAEIGAGSHIKCCRVLYQGEIILAGHEICLVPKWIWTKYFGARVLESIGAFFSWRRWTAAAKKTRNHQISDDDISQLLEVQLATDNGRGQSCRFDELVRQFRLFLAKKMRKGSIRIPNNDLETVVKHEAIAFVERFAKAMIPLDKRELVGYKYTPAPTDTSNVRLPNSVSRLSEFLAHNAHEVWSQGRIAQGWKWGVNRDNEKKLHPDLITYEQLSEEAKQYDRETSMEALKVIQALGYVMNPAHNSGSRMSSQNSLMDIDVDFGEAVPEGETYVPKPILTDDIELSPELNSLVELLAENTHDVWAKKRMEEGWVYGPKRNDDKKEHDGLVPYVYLTPEEKDMDRNTAVQTVKCILRCGFTFKHKEHQPSAKFKMFGRSEDVKTTHLDEATTVAMNIQKAKNAFLSRRNTHKTYGSVTFADKPPMAPPLRAASVDLTMNPPRTPLTPLTTEFLLPEAPAPPTTEFGAATPRQSLDHHPPSISETDGETPADEDGGASTTTTVDIHIEP